MKFDEAACCYFAWLFSVFVILSFSLLCFADKMPVEKRDSIISDKKISPNGQGLYFHLPFPRKPKGDWRKTRDVDGEVEVETDRIVPHFRSLFAPAPAASKKLFTSWQTTLLSHNIKNIFSTSLLSNCVRRKARREWNYIFGARCRAEDVKLWVWWSFWFGNTRNAWWMTAFVCDIFLERLNTLSRRIRLRQRLGTYLLKLHSRGGKNRKS